MGTVAEKLTYLNGTKSSLKTAINNLGGNIDNNTTFRQYANVLNDIYSNLPKVSDTGTNVSLSPTLKGRLGIVPKGNTLQDGEPTPSTPVEIQSATGTQKVVVSGKNKCDGINQNVYLNQAVTSGGIASDNSGLYIKVNGGNYTVSTTISQARYRVACSNVIPPSVGTTTVYNGQNKDNTNNSITIDTTGYDYLIVNATDLSKIQIEKGNTATDYQPYQEPQEVDIELDNIELNKIGDYEDYIDGTPDNWVLYKNIGKVVLNGSENWTYDTAGGFNRFSTLISNSYVGTGRQACLSNYFKNNLTSNADGICFIVSRNVYLYKNDITTANDFKTWLSTHNTEVLYVLAETQQTPITDTNLVSQLNELYYLQSYNDTTNIDVTGNLPMRITASAIKGE